MNLDKRLAGYVRRHTGQYCFYGTLMDTKGGVDLHLGNSGLDELDLKDIIVLSQLCVNEKPYSVESIAYILSYEPNFVSVSLSLLVSLGFADEENSEFWASDRAVSMISALAIETMKFDRLKYEQNLKEIETIDKMLAETNC